MAPDLSSVPKSQTSLLLSTVADAIPALNALTVFQVPPTSSTAPLPNAHTSVGEVASAKLTRTLLGNETFFQVVAPVRW